MILIRKSPSCTAFQGSSTCTLATKERGYVRSVRSQKFQNTTNPQHSHRKQHRIAIMDALRSVAQPITQNLPKPIADLGVSLLGPVCYKKLILDIDPTQTECVKFAISKGLGIGIIAASSIVKVPQLIKLINSQSAEGLSFLSYLLESSAYLISLSYNVRHEFPFSTYGETALILVQNIAIASLVLKYSGNTLGIAGWLGGLIAAGSALFNPEWVDGDRLSLLQATAGVLGVAAKVPQILTIWMEGGTGQLSAFAVSLSLPPPSNNPLYETKNLTPPPNRSSTTSSVPSPASSPPSKKSTTRSSSTASSLASPSTSCSSCKSCTTGTPPCPRTQSRRNLRNPLLPIARRLRVLCRAVRRLRMRMLRGRALVLGVGDRLLYGKGRD